MQSSCLTINTSWLKININGQAVILILGGLFLLYKSTHEIFEKVEAETTPEDESSIKLSL